jgi:hypothetical protein
VAYLCLSLDVIIVVDDLAQQQVHLNQAEEFIAQDALGCHCFLAVIGLTGANC